MEKLNHAGFADLNSMMGDLSAIEAGTQHGVKEQGLFRGIDNQDFCFASMRTSSVCLKLVHNSKTFASTHVMCTKCIA